jgi:hypothetical protein
LILGVDDLEEAARRMKGGGFELIRGDSQRIP